MSDLKNLQSVASNLFFGEIEESSVFPFPNFSDEQKEMAKTMCDAFNKFAEDNIDAAKFDLDHKVPVEVLNGLAELGLCGLGVPEDFGGLGLDSTLYARVFSEVAGVDGSVATMLGAHQSIGFKALLNEGSDEQKAHWLPKLASGESWASFCLTEPGSGSDAYSIKTKAVKNDDDTYTITGQKLWITNAGHAQFYSVFAKTEHDKNGETVEKISCFIVEKDREGVSFGEPEEKMGIRASETRAVYFDKVTIPASNMIGEPGKGFKIAMNVLNTGRLSLGTGSVGGMKTILKHATAHAKGRKQFDKAITEFGLIQEKLADMASMIYASESAAYLTTGNMTRGMSDFAIESAICKVHNSECLWEVSNMATQIAAGCGYMCEYPYERMMRDSRINLIFEGTNEILRCFVALMGIKGPGEGLKELGKIADVGNALADPIKSLGVFSNFAKNRIGKMMGSKSLAKCHESLEEESSQWSGMLGEFAIAVENALFKFGGKIIDHELPQKRIAEMAIDLYVSLAVLSRTTSILNDESVGQDKKDYSLLLAKLTCHRNRKRFISNLKANTKNQDKNIKKTSDFVADFDGYGLDITDY